MANNSHPSIPALANGSDVIPSGNDNSVPTSESITATPGLSADEIALYDRQIRLWGAQAQERIRSANILLISLRALGTEIAKNLTLAGISSLTIVDDDLVTEEDLGAQYFLRQEDIGKPELNPRVAVKQDCTITELISKDPSYFETYDCVIACDHDFLTLSAINTAVRFANRPFYAAGVHGFYGYIFADLVTHEFVVEREKSNVPTVIGAESPTRSVLSVTHRKDNDGKNIEIVKKLETYCPLILANTSPLPADILSRRRQMKGVPALLPCLRALFDFQRVHARLPGHTSQDLVAFTTLATERSRELQLPPETLRAGFLRSFIQNIGAEIVPTAAFVGGRLSEDVINVLGKRQQPIQNFALFDGEGLDGRIYSLYSPPPEVAMMTNGMMPMDLTNVVQPDLPLSEMGNGVDAMQSGVALLPTTATDDLEVIVDFGRTHYPGSNRRSHSELLRTCTTFLGDPSTTFPIFARRIQNMKIFYFREVELVHRNDSFPLPSAKMQLSPRVLDVQKPRDVEGLIVESWLGRDGLCRIFQHEKKYLAAQTDFDRGTNPDHPALCVTPVEDCDALTAIQLLFGMFHGTFIFTDPPVYHWYLSATAIFLNISWSLHNIIAWIKNKPFLSTWGSRVYITTVLLVQPYWVLEITANFLYFDDRSALFIYTRPYEALFRDPWWIFTVLSLFYEIRTRYEFGYIEIMRVSPRFAILLGAMLLSIGFIIVDILAVTHVIHATGLPDGVNPFWKLAFIFKCLTDTIVLDDFKTALDRLKTYRLHQMGSILSDGVRGDFNADVEQLRQKKENVATPPMPAMISDSGIRTWDWSAHHVEDRNTSDELDLEAALRMDFEQALDGHSHSTVR
nr:dna damage tolerance protein rhc31 [Quercus suber]